jgi:hypothetical protein
MTNHRPLVTQEDLEALGRELTSATAAIDTAQQLLKIRNRRGKTVSLIANLAQEKYALDSTHRSRNIILKARQMGITTWVAGEFFLRTITHPGTTTVQVAHTQEAAEEIFRIVHRFFHNLPEALRADGLKSARVSQRRIVIPSLDSEYLVETAGDRNAGRGLTITNLHCTELAHWPGPVTDTLSGLLATLSPDGRLVIESTPNGAGGCFWREWQDAPKTNTQRHFFPWWLEPEYAAEPVSEDSLTEEERKLLAEQPQLTLGQIAFRRQIRARFRRLAAQEYAEDAEACFLSSGSCYFDLPAIDARLRALPPILEEQDRIGLCVWARPLPGRHYLVAVDPAGGGVDGDCTVIEVIDLVSGMQCAESSEHMSLAEAADEARKLASRYNSALLAVERNGIGEAVLAHLHGQCRYDHLYLADDNRAGWRTTDVSRDTMLAQVEAALVQNPEIFSSQRLLRECRTFVRQPSGKYAAQAGQYDDCVMGFAVALAARHDFLTADRFRHERLRLNLCTEVS